MFPQARRLNLDVLFGLTWSNVGFCHHSRGCKLALTGIFGANGIAQEHIGEGRVFVGSAKSGRIYVAEPQPDDSLDLKGVIRHGKALSLPFPQCRKKKGNRET